MHTFSTCPSRGLTFWFFFISFAENIGGPHFPKKLDKRKIRPKKKKTSGEIFARAHRRRANIHGLSRKNDVDVRRGINMIFLTWTSLYHFLSSILFSSWVGWTWINYCDTRRFQNYFHTFSNSTEAGNHKHAKFSQSRLLGGEQSSLKWGPSEKLGVTPSRARVLCLPSARSTRKFTWPRWSATRLANVSFRSL